MSSRALSIICIVCFEVNSLASTYHHRLGELLAIPHTLMKEGKGHGIAEDFYFLPTPSQPKGPFYPVVFPEDTDADLTTMDQKHYAKGIEVYIQGKVMTLEGTVIPGAKVEIWQACQSGKYNHPKDSNSATPDPAFQYYGVSKSSDDGYYLFKTIVPGPYPASNQWWRPPHIHFMVTAPHFKTLVTQLYFDGDSFSETIAVVNDIKVTGEFLTHLNELDLLINRVPKDKRKQLVVRFKEVVKDKKTTKLGVFHLYLERKNT